MLLLELLLDCFPEIAHSKLILDYYTPLDFYVLMSALIKGKVENVAVSVVCVLAALDISKAYHFFPFTAHSVFILLAAMSQRTP